MSTEKPPSHLPGPGFADLEQLPWAFSQRDLLTTARFRDQCGRRGSPILLDEQLEALHRQGVLVPLVRRDGDLVEEPAAVGFQPWRTYPRSNQFYYSPYQLLAAPALGRLLTHMTPRRRAAPRRLLARLVGRRQRRRVVFDLDLTFPEAQFDLSRLPSRELVIALSALEARYLPLIVHRVHAPRPLDLQAWPDYANGFDPNAMLAWLGWQPEQLKAAAYQLLGYATSIDPQQRWHRLARLAEPERWDELRGLALAANDHRVAAELLLLFYEDLVELRAVPPLEQLPPRHQRVWHQLDERLATDRNELEEVLTEFGLSPHPSVVLAVEGETEELTVGRIIDLLVPAGQRGHIRVRNLHGARRDLTLLADELARPLAGAPARGNWLTLRQPPTRLLVAVDPEEKYATTALCDEQRRKLVDRVDRTLRFGGVAVDRADLEALVEIRTWAAPFEFAHFTDDELAQAALAPTPARPPSHRPATGGRIPPDPNHHQEARPDRCELAQPSRQGGAGRRALAGAQGQDRGVRRHRRLQRRSVRSRRLAGGRAGPPAATQRRCAASQLTGSSTRVTRGRAVEIRYGQPSRHRTEMMALVASLRQRR